MSTKLSKAYVFFIETVGFGLQREMFLVQVTEIGTSVKQIFVPAEHSVYLDESYICMLLEIKEA